MTLSNEIIQRCYQLIASTSVAALCACGGGGDAPAPENETVTQARSDIRMDAAGVEKSALKERAALVYFIGFNPANYCENTTVYVVISEQKTKTSGDAAVVQKVVSVSAETFDSCLTMFVESFSGSIEAPEVSINKDLSIARFKGPVVFTSNLTGAIWRTIMFDLHWNGGELITYPTVKTITITPPLRSIIVTFASSRTSESLTGSMIFNGVDLMSADYPIRYVPYQPMVVSQAVISKDRVR